MLRDRSVSSRAVVDAEAHLRRIGVRRAVRRLEVAEPELASYLMEAATRLYGELDDAVEAHAKVRSVHRDAVLLALTCIEAVRRSA